MEQLQQQYDQLQESFQRQNADLQASNAHLTSLEHLFAAIQAEMERYSCEPTHVSCPTAAPQLPATPGASPVKCFKPPPPPGRCHVTLHVDTNLVEVSPRSCNEPVVQTYSPRDLPCELATRPTREALFRRVVEMCRQAAAGHRAAAELAERQRDVEELTGEVARVCGVGDKLRAEVSALQSVASDERDNRLGVEEERDRYQRMVSGSE